jgi:hypothetical protein
MGDILAPSVDSTTLTLTPPLSDANADLGRVAPKFIITDQHQRRHD